MISLCKRWVRRNVPVLGHAAEELGPDDNDGTRAINGQADIPLTHRVSGIFNLQYASTRQSNVLVLLPLQSLCTPCVQVVPNTWPHVACGSDTRVAKLPLPVSIVLLFLLLVPPQSFGGRPA